uniref:Ground-like domain-containing protein n=1 Tax=Parastrongyloides trichosuri TaxID=131310 RepID=A0A0N4Z586_PARTI
MRAKMRGESSMYGQGISMNDPRFRAYFQEQQQRDYISQPQTSDTYYPQPSPPQYPSAPIPVPLSSLGVSGDNLETNISTPVTAYTHPITTPSTTTTTAAPKNDYPLESCYTNKSGFMCCNRQLEELMHRTFNDLLKSRGGRWNKCNIQEIANKIQSHAQDQFSLNFESIAGIGDFASKSNFYGNNICKIEVGGRFLLAYATPVQEGKMFETVESVPYGRRKSKI